MRTRTILAVSLLSLTTGLASAAVYNTDEPPTLQEAAGHVQQEDWDSAIAAYRAIVKADPSNAQAQFMLGYALHASGDLDNAILQHKKAARMPSVAGMANYNLGCAYALKGKTNDAYKALDLAIAQGVRNLAQFKGDPDLKSLRADERWKPMIDSIGAISHAESALHFWVGSWDCYSTSTGTLSGTNTLSFRVGKGVIHEQWQSATDSTAGESWNTYDRTTNSWNQIWVDQSGAVLTISAPVESEYEGLMFEGKTTAIGREKTTYRMHVRPTDEGHVLQTGFESNDGGETWTQRYELEYVPKGKAYSFGDG